MTTPIVATYRQSAEEMLQSYRVFRRHYPQLRRIRRDLWILAPIAVLVFVGTAIRRDPMMWYLALVIICFIAGWFGVKRTLLKQYASRPDRDMQVTWTFTPENVTSTTEASTTTFEWRMIPRIAQGAEGFLVYMNDHHYHWLPNHAFTTDRDKEAFVQRARSRVQHFDTVK
jgi:hypothetical protein